MTADDLDLLLAYLDGSLDPAAEADLVARLKAEPDLAQELVRLARAESVLREWAHAMQLADPGPAEEPTPAARPRRAPLAWLAGGGLLAVALFVALGLGLFSNAPRPTAALARLVEAVGQVELHLPSGEATPGRDDDDLLPGLTLRVGGGGSRARVAYPDGSRLDLTAGTTVRLEGGPTTAAGRQVVLLEGYVHAEVRPQPDGRPLVLTTPHALVRVAGSRFSSATQPEATRIELEEGHLHVVRASDGQAVEVNEGFYAIIARDEPALMPEPLPTQVREHRDLVKHGGGPILAIAFAPAGDLLAVGGHDGSVLLWDAAKRQGWRQWKAHPAKVKAVAWLPGGKEVLTAGSDKQVKRWDSFTGRETGPAIKAKKDVEAFALSPDGKTVAVAVAVGRGAPGNEQVRLFDVATGQEVGKLLGHTQPVAGLVFLPDGQTLATAGRDGLVKLWSLATRDEVATLRGHVGQINAIAADPDGHLLATGGRDGAIKLWDAVGRFEVRSLPGHPREVRGVAFSPDGRVLASTGTDGAARLWDMHSGAELAHLTGLPYAAPAVAFSRDGRLLAASSWDPQVKVWDTPAGLRPRW